MNRKKTILSIILIVCFPLTVYANMVWPALYLVGGMISWLPILIGLIVEYFFVKKLTGFDVKKSINVDVAMNLASSLLGVILIPIAGIIWEIFPGIMIHRIFNIGTFNPATWVATFIFAVMINAFIENFVIEKFFKCKLGWRGYWWLVLANTITVGIAFVALYNLKKIIV